MKIKEMKINGKEVDSARWNGVYVYQRATTPTSGFPNEYTWEYNATTGAYPTEVDNTEYFDFTRRYFHYSSSKKTTDYIKSDFTDGGYMYQLKTSGNYAKGKMYFSMTVPAHTTLQVESLLKGFEGHFADEYRSKLYFTETEPISYSVESAAGVDFTNAALVLYNEINDCVSTGTSYRSSLLDYRIGTLTNDTDEDKTYYVVFYHMHDGDVSNYWCGLFVKYLKFTKI